MFQIELDSQLVCSLLSKNSSLDLTYSQRAFSGRFTLPLGQVSANIFPVYCDQTLIFNIPFSSVKANFGGQFFISKIVKTFWGMISNAVESASHSWLRRQGLPDTAVRTSKTSLEDQEIGQISISIEAVNLWLESKQSSLLPNLSNLEFLDSGIKVTGTLQGK